jgi:hypothetical protein
MARIILSDHLCTAVEASHPSLMSGAFRYHNNVYDGFHLNRNIVEFLRQHFITQKCNSD